MIGLFSVKEMLRDYKDTPESGREGLEGMWDDTSQRAFD